MLAQQKLIEQKLLLQMEYAAEKAEYEKTSLQMGVGRKVKRGDAWWPVTCGKSYYNSLNQPCIEILCTASDDIEHNFEFNRPVVFFKINHTEETTQNSKPKTQNISFLKIKGTVSYAEQDRMVICLQDMSHALELQEIDLLGVQLFFDERTYQLMFEALDKVINAKNNRLAYLRDLFYSPSQKAEHFHFNDIKFPWLNESQEEAVNKVLRAKDVMIVHGPPGTGKTTTLVEAIHETLQRESQVLVCAQSNMAVDWISERLHDRGINVLRIGNPSRVSDKMLSFTYERRFESHPDYPQLWAIRKAMRELKGKKRKDNSYHQKVERLKARATELEIRINQDIFGEARVIASTLTGSANRILQGMKFTTLFIDEAAQALEAACWIGIRKVSRVVFAGDHCQLPPTVKNFAALKAGLGKTLMERIVENKPEEVSLLKVQYRMTEKIMKFSSDWFYDGMVQSDPSVRFRGILDYDQPMLWIDTHDEDCKEEFVGESYGRINKQEAELTLKYFEEYFTKIGKQRILDECIDVGIISPYRAQVQYLRKKIKSSQFFKPYRHLISVNTVDGFQGQERDIIFISLVRANEEGQIGFLSDLRRMNVAITRARMKLVILGDAETMAKHKFYKLLYEYCQK